MMLAGELICEISAILVHEAGHALAATVLGYKWTVGVARWHGVPAGPAIRVAPSGRRDSALIAVAAPVLNLAVGGASLYAAGFTGWVAVFGVFNVLFGLVSFVPVRGFDGRFVLDAVRG